MKLKIKNKNLIIIIIAILVIIFGMFAFRKVDDSKIVETKIEEARVESQSIETTLTAPGEVKSEKEEKLTLNTSYNFLMLCVEKEELVKKGENIVKYTNGKFLTAPYDCVVKSYYVPSAKEKVTSSHYIEVASVEELYMDINIVEEQIGKVSVGQEVKIVANYDETKSYTGTITKINAIGTHSSSGTTFAAIASIKNDGTLKLGMSATCTITVDKNDNLPCLPIEAVIIENNERYVNLIKENGSTEKRNVETGKANANLVEIVSGLELDDRVRYETKTVTVKSSNKENNKNVFTSLFGNPGRGPSGRGGF